MLACVNKECANYKQELEEGVEVCPLCGTKPEQMKAKNNQTLGAIALIIAFASVLMLYSSFWVVGFITGPASVVLAAVSKSIVFIILTSLLLVALVGMFFLFVKP